MWTSSESSVSAPACMKRIFTVCVSPLSGSSNVLKAAFFENRATI